MTEVFLKPTAALSTIQLENRIAKVRSQLPTDDQETTDRQKLKQACAAMESLFLHQLMKEMRRTIPKSGFISGGKGEEIFTDMLDYQRAQEITANQGMGIAEMLEKQLSATISHTEPEAETAADTKESKDFLDSADNHSKPRWHKP